MSESVKIGGVGKNPAIDKINSLNAVDIKNYAVSKMEQLLLTQDFSENKELRKMVPIDFDKADWKGETNDVKYERRQMAESKLLREPIVSEYSKRLETTFGRVDTEKVSIQMEAAGDICQFGGIRNINIQSFGKAVTGEPDLLSNLGDTKNDQSSVPGEYSRTGKEIQSYSGNDGMVFVRYGGNERRLLP